MLKKIAFIGVGNMARAIIDGIQGSDLDVNSIVLYDKFYEQYSLLNEGRSEYIYASNIKEAIEISDCIVLAVKPQNFPEVLSEISSVPQCAGKMYITIAAGITSEYISRELHGAPVVRVLPNLPITIRQGVTVICNNDAIEPDAFGFVKSIFETTGSVILIDESQMNAMISVTSSSPAYVFKFIESICNGAEAQGLSYDNITDIVCDVFIGSALLLKQTCATPSELISKVSSKGGTTQRAIESMTNDNISEIIEKAMVACTKRADELGS